MQKISFIISFVCFCLIPTWIAKGETNNTTSQTTADVEFSISSLPDSIVYRDIVGNYVEKYFYVYDNEGNRTSEIYYLWDMSANNWKVVHEYEYAYDKFGNYTLNAYYEPDSITNTRIGIYKYEYGYDNSTNLTSYASHRWNQTISGWEKYSQYEYAYDDWGNRIRYEYYSRSADLWSGQTKYKDLYDDHNLLLQHINCIWNDTTGVWIDVSKSEYFYNQDGSIDESVDYNKSSSSDTWIEHVKYKYAHNITTDTLYNYTWNDTANDWQLACKYEFTGNGNQVSYVSYVWDSASNNWTYGDRYESAYESVFDNDDHLLSYADSLFKYTYAYDEYGNRTSSASQTWDAMDEVWKDEYKSEVVYDDQDNLTLFADYNWDSQASQWSGNDKYEFVYDEDGHSLFVSDFIWDANRWIGSYKLGYEYANAGNLLQSSNYDWHVAMNDWIARTRYTYIYDEEHKRISEENRSLRNEENDAWTLYETGTYYYPTSSNIDVGTSNVKFASVNIYPNPASNYITVSLPGHTITGISLRLFDVNGHLVLEQNDAQTNHPVLLRDVRPGVYIYRIKIDNRYYKGMLIMKNE